MKFDKLLLSSFGKFRFRILLLTFYSLLNIVFSFIIPLTIKYILQGYEQGAKIQIYFFAIFFLALVLQFFISNIYMKNYINFSYKYKSYISKELFEKFFSVDFLYILEKGPSYFTNRIISASDHLFDLIGSFGSSFFMSFMTAAISLIYVFFISKILFLLFLIIPPLAYFSYRKLNNKLQEKTNTLQVTAAVSGQNIFNFAQNFFMIKQFYNYQETVKYIKRFYEIMQKKNSEVMWFAYLLSNCVQFSLNLIKNSIIFLALYYYVVNKFQVSSFIFINMILLIYFDAIDKLVKLNINIRDVKSSLFFINNEINDKIEDQKGEIILDKVDNIKINICNFILKEKKIISDFTLEIQKGDKIAFVGKSGSGKSTVLKIIAGFFYTDNVYINNKSINKYRLSSLREKILILPNTPFIFPGTIKENLFIGIKNDIEEKISLLEKNEFYSNFIKDFPKSLNSEIKEGGQNISEGQKQKISLLRLLLRDPEIIIFDESFSSIDSYSEELFHKTINELYGNRIFIIVSHRESTIKYAKKIVFIQDGKIQFTGYYNEIYKKSNSFRELFNIAENENKQ